METEKRASLKIDELIADISSKDKALELAQKEKASLEGVDTKKAEKNTELLSQVTILTTQVKTASEEGVIAKKALSVVQAKFEKLQKESAAIAEEGQIQAQKQTQKTQQTQQELESLKKQIFTAQSDLTTAQDEKTKADNEVMKLCEQQVVMEKSILDMEKLVSDKGEELCALQAASSFNTEQSQSSAEVAEKVCVEGEVIEGLWLFLYTVQYWSWVSYFVWSGAFTASSGFLQSYPIISLALPMTCQYTDIYSQSNAYYIYTPKRLKMRWRAPLLPKIKLSQM